MFQPICPGTGVACGLDCAVSQCKLNDVRQTDGPTGPEWQVRVPTERETLVREMLPHAVASYFNRNRSTSVESAAEFVAALYSIAAQTILQGRQ